VIWNCNQCFLQKNQESDYFASAFGMLHNQMWLKSVKVMEIKSFASAQTSAAKPTPTHKTFGLLGAGANSRRWAAGDGPLILTRSPLRSALTQ